MWAVGSLVVRTSDSRPEGLGSMLDVTKYPPSAHGFTCRNCGGGDRGRVAIYRPFGEVSLSLNRTVTCMVLKANDRRTSCPCHDEFRGPRSDYVRQVALVTTQQQQKYMCPIYPFICCRPGNSPDLNPIENLWHRLKTLVRLRYPSNKRELIDVIIVSLHHVITKEELKNIANSKKHRYQAVIKLPY
ncbi:uncharacterized protein TNCV_2822661 [Trichonephila clavipes]|nr:uncharacterized protein TNCV_2822661 [Trichonephila clavipes]